MSAGDSEKVLLIGWDAADWNLIRPLLDARQLPNLKSLIDRGVSGALNSPPPLISPMLWTTAVTGKRATRHNITGPFEPRPDRRGTQVASRFSRKAKTIWEILDDNAIPTIAVNFPATHPAKSRNGAVISNLFPLVQNASAIHPPNLYDDLKNFCVKPQDIDAASLLTFVPRAKKIDPKNDSHLMTIAQILAHTATVHAATTFCLEKIPWQFAAICYTGLHQFSHLFMSRDDEMYSGVITAAYRFHDLMLGRLLELAGPNANVLLISDHGFRTARPVEESMIAAHREQGIFVMAGPGIRQAGNFNGASLLDITPTILSLFDLPSGADMSGKSLDELITREPQSDRRISWEDGATIEPAISSDADESVAHLIELGYVEQPDRHAKIAIDQVERENQLNLALAWLESGNAREAIKLLEPLAQSHPNSLDCAIALARAYGEANQISACRALVEKLIKDAPDTAIGHAAIGLCDLAARRAASAIEHFKRAENLNSHSPQLHLAIGQAYLRMSKFSDAQRVFNQAMQSDPNNHLLNEEMAAAMLGSGDAIEAIKYAAKAAELRPNRARPRYLLGFAKLHENRIAEAIDDLIHATKLDPNFVAAHRRLSEAFNLLGDSHRAAEHQKLAQLAMIHKRLNRRAIDTAR